jgi:hypothetical protein
MPRWINRPIDQWPGKLTTARRTTPFSASWGSTMETLERELHHLGAKEVVLQRAFREADLRLDGEPRSGARPEHPGVILSFESRFGPLRFACDRFIGWEANLRAIALGLEALRRIDRYGISQGTEQYVGWAALPAGGHTHAWAQGFIAEHGGSVSEALKRYHPDNPESGDRAIFDQVMEAKRLMEGVAS